jgi:hypothetical protein
VARFLLKASFKLKAGTDPITVRLDVCLVRYAASLVPPLNQTGLIKHVIYNTTIKLNYRVRKTSSFALSIQY